MPLVYPRGEWTVHWSPYQCLMVLVITMSKRILNKILQTNAYAIQAAVYCVVGCFAACDNAAKVKANGKNGNAAEMA